MLKLEPNRNTVFQITLLTATVIIGIIWSVAVRERAQYKRDWEIYQTAVRLIDKEKKFAEAQTHLLDLMSRDRESAILRFRYGYTLAATGKHAEALASYEEARTLDPFLVRDSVFLLLSADSFFKTGQYGKARSYIEAAVKRGDLTKELLDHANNLIKALDQKGTP